MRATIGTGLGIAAATILIAGCSSDTGSAKEAAAPPSGAQTNWIEKRVGERAGAFCVDGEHGDRDDCALQFTVTDISNVPLSDCTYNDDVSPESRVVRVNLDTEGVHRPPKPYETLDPGSVVNSSNWAGRAADGYATKAEVAIGCGDFNPGPFYDGTKVGQKSRGTILFEIPRESTELELSAASHEGGWRWSLPPADAVAAGTSTPTTASTTAAETPTEQPNPAPTGSAVTEGSPCLESEARSFGTDAQGRSLVCNYMGAGGYAWVQHASNSGQVHDIGDPCDSTVDSVAQDPSGKAIMCGGTTWIGGP